MLRRKWYQLTMDAFVPIGFVRSTRTVVEDDNWDAVSAYIQLDASRFSPHALQGLQDFSHVEIVFLLDRVDPDKVERGARRPRNNPAWPEVGIFAQRAKNRPNRIATTVCRVFRVHQLELHVAGLDAIDGSPVLDIKPWVIELGPRGPVHQPEWMSQLMREYWRR